MRRVASLALLLIAVSSAPAEQRFGSRSTAGLSTNYVFRGARRGPVGIIRDSFTEYRFDRRWAVRLETWSYLQLENGQGTGESRYGGSVLYSPSRAVTLRAGGTYYARNDEPLNELFQGPPTAEAFAGVTWHLPGDPTLTAWYDFDSNVGTYVELSARHRLPLGQSGWRADLSGAVGWDWGRTQGFTAAHGRVALWYPLVRNLHAGPALDLWVPAGDVDPLTDNVRCVWSLNVAYGTRF